MTRINLVDPNELTDQHLFAEFRQIKMVPKSLRRSLRAIWQKEFDKDDTKGVAYKKTMEILIERIPKAYTLNTGHVSFFYDKGRYLRFRYEKLKDEIRRRGINFNENSLLDPDDIFGEIDYRFQKDYVPTKEAIVTIKRRIAEKIEMKVSWYRHFGVPLSKNPYKEYLNAE